MSPASAVAEDNRRAYETDDVVNRYEKRNELLTPEQTIFAMLRDRLPSMRLLDLGVGGGRTTLHLAGAVQEYLGIDFSAPMVEACRRRFQSRFARARFEEGDARDLTMVRDGSFDMVLFSYNGIDCVSHEDRLRVLGEVRRALADGGWFCFSSHNLRSMPFIPLKLSIAGARDWLYETWQLLRWNRDLVVKLRQPHALIKDGRNAPVYYVTVAEQLRQLRDAGFENIEVYSMRTGEPVRGPGRELLREPWVYFLCRKPSAHP